MKKIMIAWMLLWILPAFSGADVIILKTGEKFTADKAWEEDGKIKFNMQGLVVGIDKKDVKQVIKTGQKAEKTPPSAKKPAAPKKAAKKPTEKPPKKTVKKQTPKTVTKATPKPAKATKKPTKKPTKKSKKPVKKASKAKKQTEKQPPAAPPAKRASLGKSAKKPTVKPGTIGFRNLAWNMKAEDIGDLVKTETDPSFGGVVQYMRSREELIFGKARLEGVAYGFWFGRFYTISIWARGHDNYAAMREEAVRRFGKGFQSKKNAERLVWYDKATDRMLEFDPEMDTAMLWLRSRKVDKQIKKLYGK